MSDIDELAAKYGGTPVDLDALAAKYGGTAEKSRASTASGVAGAVTRGLAPVVGGAALGAALGAPIGGVGAIPGAIAGAAAGGLAEPIGDPVVSLINRAIGTRFKLPSQAIQDLLTSAGVPQAQTPLEKVAQSGASGVAGALGMSGVGSVLSKAASPVISSVGRTLASNPGAQAAGGLGAAGASQIVANEGGSVPLQVLAGVAGGIGATRIASPRLPAQPTQIPQVVKEADSLGIPVLTTDVVPPSTPIGKFFQSTGEKIPFIGSGPLRAAQQQKRIDAVKSLIDDYNIDGPVPPAEVMADLLKKRGDTIAKYTGYKKEVAEKLGGIPVDVSKTVSAINKEILELAELNNPEVRKLMVVLDGWRDSIQNQSISNIEKNRRLIGEQLKLPDMASISTEGEKIIRRIYGPLREDIQAFVKANGTKQDATKWMVANKRLSESARELEHTAFKKALDSGQMTPEDFRPLLYGKPSDVAMLYKSLTPAGRDSARRYVIGDLVDDYKILSPDVFANKLQSKSATIKGMFEGKEKDRIDGLLRVMNYTKRASAAVANPPTGAQTLPFVGGAVLTDLFGGAGAATAATIGAGGLFRIYESAPVRNIMIKIGQSKPGSESEKRLVNQAIAIMQTQAEAN